MTDLITSIFSTHHPNYSDVQVLLYILLTGEERKLVIDKAIEKAHRLHQEDTNGTPNPMEAVPLVSKQWKPRTPGTLQKMLIRRIKQSCD